MVITPQKLVTNLLPAIAKKQMARTKILQKIDKTIKRQLAKFDGISVSVYFLRSRFEWDSNISYMMDLYEENGWLVNRSPHKKDPSQKRIFGFHFRPKDKLTETLLALPTE